MSFGRPRQRIAARAARLFSLVQVIRSLRYRVVVAIAVLFNLPTLWKMRAYEFYSRFEKYQKTYEREQGTTKFPAPYFF